MQVILNTDQEFTADGEPLARVETDLTAASHRFRERVTRVEAQRASER
jgi:hypothetical protein